MTLFLHHFAQAWMLLFSCLSVYCVARQDRWHRWGFVFGLTSEPAYIYVSIATDPVQWGILLLTLWWTWQWGVGGWRRFRKNET